MAPPIAGISQFILGLLLLTAWFIVRRHAGQRNAPTLKSVNYFQKFFLYFAIFNFVLTLPHLALYITPEQFPLLMGLGYTIAHIFVFVSIGYLSRMTASLMPPVARFEKVVFYAWLTVAAIVTVLNLQFATFQNQPTFDHTSGLTTFHIPSFIGAILGITGILGYLPLVILFIVNSIKNTGRKRTRAILLTFGLAITMIAGPLHAVAQSWQTYVAADIFNAMGVALIAAGVIYQINENLQPRPQDGDIRHASSNTV